jgi:hypothetical protein
MMSRDTVSESTTAAAIRHIQQTIDILRLLREPVVPKRPSNARYQHLSMAISTLTRVQQDLRGNRS